ncbi:MAG: hypothetical protein ACFFCS_18280 [Candidatus Hodarchaeota archaeon]
MITVRESIKRLGKYYGVKKARAIIHALDGIWIGNLTGNTLDAFKSRLKGIPPEKGSFLLELIVFVIGSFVVKFLFKMGPD